jgi:hypothetical protein
MGSGKIHLQFMLRSMINLKKMHKPQKTLIYDEMLKADLHCTTFAKNCCMQRAHNLSCTVSTQLTYDNFRNLPVSFCPIVLCFVYAIQATYKSLHASHMHVTLIQRN